MRNVLTICLSGHWAVVFALSAAQAAAGASHSAGLAAVATGEMLAATLFSWAAVAAWARRAKVSDDVADIARAAIGVGGLMLALGAVVHGRLDGTAAALSETAIPLAALGVSFLVMRAEQGRGAEEPAAESESRAQARRLAVAAAHGTLLSRLSRRERGD